VTSPSVRFAGLDVGDRKSHLCVVDDQRRVVERVCFPTSRESLTKVFAERPRCQVVLEAGSQSPWMSSLLREFGHEVRVADPRKVAAITHAGRKTDRRDAETLARLLQGMPELLGSVYHRGERAQADVALLRARDLLVRTRTTLVQHVRSTLKVFGLPPVSASPMAFHRKARAAIPELLQPALVPILDTLKEVEERIRQVQKTLERAADERYPDTWVLRQVNAVGPVVSMAFVLTVDDPARFTKSRMVGPWVGLCPRVFASGDSNPQLSISKIGNGYLRRLLVQSAHYILGPFGKDCDLRRYGLRLSERGGRAARRRAAVAVARRLAVLLHRLWVSREPYEPLRHASRA
jgi:transposase